MSDRVFGLILFGVAGFFIYTATQIQTSLLSDPVGPKMFPIIVGSVAIVAAIVVMAFPDDEPDWPRPRSLGVIAIAIVVLGLYAYSVNPAGFLVPTAIASGAISYLIAPKPAQAVLAGLGVAIVLFFVFKFALGLSLRGFPREWAELNGGIDDIGRFFRDVFSDRER